MVLSTPALADSECTYVDKTVVQTTGTIEQTRNYEYETAQYTEEKRVCAVKLDVKIGKKWVKTRDFYVFGPDMSQTEACNKAKDKAKLQALELHAPQIVTSNVEHYCEEKTPERVVETPPKEEKRWVSVTDLDGPVTHGADINANRKRHDRFNNNMRLYNFVGMLFGQFVLN